MRSGHFVVNDLVGISLLTASSYLEEKHKYLLITSNLYKAQKVYSLLKSLLPKTKISLFGSDELIRAEDLSLSKEMIYERILIKNYKSSETVKLTKSSILNLSIKTKRPIIN